MRGGVGHLRLSINLNGHQYDNKRWDNSLYKIFQVMQVWGETCWTNCELRNAVDDNYEGRMADDDHDHEKNPRDQVKKTRLDDDQHDAEIFPSQTFKMSFLYHAPMIPGQNRHW